MNDGSTNTVRILTYQIDETVLRALGNRRRNQLFGCMHAHNELTFLNRLLLFTHNPTAAGDLHDHAQAVQMWSVLQMLAGKLFETWIMLADRILRACPPDPVIAALCSDHQAALAWLRDYFGDLPLKDSVIRFVRDRTAFHYDPINTGQALDNLAARENTVHLAQEHPANTLYYVGSAAVFRTIFVLVADRAIPAAGRSFDERLSDGFRIVIEDVKTANWHIHVLLYGLIKAMLEEAMGGALGEPSEVTPIANPPSPDIIGLPPWIDIDRMKL